ncbi:MAG: CoA pyrophosphatase [Pseudomonadota bacterium]
MAVNVTHIEEALAGHKPRRKLLRQVLKRSAVAMILRDRGDETDLLMIKRAEHEGDPWSGHMAFPGGRMEPEDRHGLDVARRETREEIGHELDASTCIGRLSDIMTHPQLRRRPMVVSPYLFRLEQDTQFEPNYEVDEVVWIPVSFLMESDNRDTLTWRRSGAAFTLPCYRYQGREIWGLSLMMLDELLGILGFRNRA